MSIEVICSCGSKQRVPNSYENAEVKCTKCGKMVIARSEQYSSGSAAPVSQPAGLSERRLELGNYTLIVKFEPQWAGGVDRLLKTVANKIGMGSPSLNGTKITVGWAVYTIRQHVEDLYIEEPDFNSEPHRATHEGISTSLRIASLQEQFSQTLPGVRFFECTCFDSMTVPLNVFEYRTLFLRRLRVAAHLGSGLYIAPEDPVDLEKRVEQQKKKVQVHEETEKMESWILLKNRPGMLQAVGLPPDYMAEFEGNDLLRIFGLKNKVVWEKGKTK